MVNIEAIIWYLFLADSIGANITALFFQKWAKKNFKGFWKHLPVTKGWALIYLVLVLWVGCALYRLGILPY